MQVEDTDGKLPQSPRGTQQVRNSWKDTIINLQGLVQISLALWKLILKKMCDNLEGFHVLKLNWQAD